ncbi:CDP-diacylglycerol--serine O-phosphatidyltransferase [Emcibacter sp. SYSU 3D8]|uniref:CDP-diacylglycerol--serine O-phosphatidyltransferase n=1 Tax=Emcibacter sp. SYSU 3D8 TaxID=3133969 RepID=UPI0031FE8966
MKAPLHRRLPPFVPIRVLAPTVLTVLALCSGVSSIRFAFQERWEAAVIAILLASLFDLLDGRVARMIKGTTKFGAELDSLSDVICFGVAPAIILYFWTLHEVPRFGWAVTLMYCVCCALRLARFNIMDQSAAEDGTVHSHFMGMPAPAAAGLALVPFALTFHTESDYFRQPEVCAVYLAVLALMMVSRVPTLSTKHVRINRHLVLPLLVGAVILAALLASSFWATYVGLAMIYAGLLPVVAIVAMRQRQDEPPEQPAGPLE